MEERGDGMARVLEVVAERRGIRIICMTAAAVLLAVSLGGLVYSSSSAEAQETPATAYQHRGTFDYLVYVTPGILYGDEFPRSGEAAADPETAEEQPAHIPPVLFRELLEDLDLAFSYRVDAAEPLQSVHSEATVTIIAEHPRMWQKDMRDWTLSRTGRELRLQFPFEYDLFESYVKDIEEEIALTRTQRDFIIEARVRTTAETVNGHHLDEEYVHSIRIIVKDRTVEFDGDLRHTERRSVDDMEFTLKGWFDYEAYMGYSRLYEGEVLRSEPLPVAEEEERPRVTPQPVTTIGPGRVLYPRTIQSIDGSFSYDLASEGRIADEVCDMEVTATLSSGDRWSKTLELVAPQQADSGEVSFPIDIHYFDRVVEAIGEQTGARTGSYDIAIEARVHVRAGIGDGRIDEVYTQRLTGKRDGAQLTFGETLSDTKMGSIGGGTVVVSNGREQWRPPSIAGALTGVALLAVVGIARVRSGSRRDDTDRQVRKAKKAYRDVLVEIDQMPAVERDEISIPVSTIEDLARVAEQSGKPVLYYAGYGEHQFSVLDGQARYVHTLSQPQARGPGIEEEN